MNMSSGGVDNDLMPQYDKHTDHPLSSTIGQTNQINLYGC